MILKKDRKIPLDKFINYCLYDKNNGYYMNNNPFGITGDFTTAPNISRLFSEMIAIWTISFLFFITGLSLYYLKDDTKKRS